MAIRLSKSARLEFGLPVKARVDAGKKIWYGEMKIPFTAIDTRKPAAGNKLRIGLFRMEGYCRTAS